MKKYAMLVVASMFMFNVATTGQEQTRPQDKKGERNESKQDERLQVSPEMKAEKMAKKLGLTETEKIKVQALFVKQEANRDQHQAEIKKVREERIALFEKERKTQDAELEKIIGKDKFQKLENDRSERKAKIIERRNEKQDHLLGKRNQYKEYNRIESTQFSAQNRADKMAKALALTDVEKAKVQELFEKQKVKMEQHLAIVKKVKEEQKAQFASERKSMDTDLEKIIGSEKFQKYSNKRAEVKENIKEKREENKTAHQGREWQNNRNKHEGTVQGSPEAKAAKMTRMLGLTDSQKADLQSLFEKQVVVRHEQMQKVEKQREEMKSQFEAQRKTTDQQLANILGPEKFQKYQSMRTERQDKMKNKSDRHKPSVHKNNKDSN